jgi:hypothetical protein
MGILLLPILEAMVLMDNSPSDDQDQTKFLKQNALPNPSDEPSLPVGESSPACRKYQKRSAKNCAPKVHEVWVSLVLKESEAWQPVARLLFLLVSLP